MSWQQMKEIMDSNREIQRQQKRDLEEPPVVCPIDGDLLDVNARGVRNCPLGNFRWDGRVIFQQQ